MPQMGSECRVSALWSHLNKFSTSEPDRFVSPASFQVCVSFQSPERCTDHKLWNGNSAALITSLQRDFFLITDVN